MRACFSTKMKDTRHGRMAPNYFCLMETKTFRTVLHLFQMDSDYDLMTVLMSVFHSELEQLPSASAE